MKNDHVLFLGNVVQEILWRSVLNPLLLISRVQYPQDLSSNMFANVSQVMAIIEIMKNAQEEVTNIQS